MVQSMPQLIQGSGAASTLTGRLSGSLSVRADGRLKKPTHWTWNGQAVLIDDGMHVRHTREEEQDDDDDGEEQDSEDEGPCFEEYEAVDGDAAYSLGWMYANVIELSGMYDQLLTYSSIATTGRRFIEGGVQV